MSDVAMEHCSLCGKARYQVAHLAKNDDACSVESGRHIGQAVAVCNECAEAVTDMAESERDYRCSFCGKPKEDVGRLIAGPGVCICDECIDLSNQALAVDPPPGIGPGKGQRKGGGVIYTVLVTSMIEVEAQNLNEATTLVMDQVDLLRDQDERIKWKQTMAGSGAPGR